MSDDGVVMKNNELTYMVFASSCYFCLHTHDIPTAKHSLRARSLQQNLR